MRVPQVQMPNIYGAINQGYADGRGREAQNQLQAAVQQGGLNSPGAMNALSILDPMGAARMGQQGAQFDQRMGQQREEFAYRQDQDAQAQDMRRQQMAQAAAARGASTEQAAAREKLQRLGALTGQVLALGSEDAMAANWPAVVAQARAQGIDVPPEIDQWPGVDTVKMWNAQITGAITEGPKPQAAAEYGLTPLVGYLPDGTRVAMQLSKNGTIKPVDLPPGVSLGRKPIKVDAGTQVLLVDPETGATISSTPKDIVGTKVAEARGKAQGDAVTKAPKTVEQADAMLSVIEDLKSDGQLGAATGFGSYAPDIPMVNTRARSKMAQIGGKIFMQAYDGLRGGGTITEMESAKAERAMARLNANLTKEEYIDALNELAEVVTAVKGRAIDAAGGSGGGGGAIPAAPDGIGADEWKSLYGTMTPEEKAVFQ